MIIGMCYKGQKSVWSGVAPRSFRRVHCCVQCGSVALCVRAARRRPAASARGAMNIAAVVASARLRLRVWSYAFAEAVPKTRQRLHLPPQAAGTDSSECSSSSSSATVRTDAALAARILDESISSGVPLASILLSSLFLAAAKAVRLEQESPSHGSHQNRPMGVRAQRGFVLGIVCLVMALLSGSAESKAIRYFCSIYAVVAGEYTVYR